MWKRGYSLREFDKKKSSSNENLILKNVLFFEGLYKG